MQFPFARIASAIVLATCQLLAVAEAKPIAFAEGTTVMAEYGGGTMTEIQAYYSPNYRYSIGGGHLTLDSEVNDDEHDITYARLNFLPKRWNLESAQANVFVWAGAGEAQIGGTGDREFAWNAGAQFDYETRRIYASLRTDLHEADSFSHRIHTLQLGVAPYKHDYDTLAVWFVVQGRDYDDDLYQGTEWALLLRLFKRNAWLEAGVTNDGKAQAMLMFNF